MVELSLPYLNALAAQLIFISAFLGGFSAAILGTLIVSKNSTRTLRALVLSTAFSATAFIVTVFSMTQLVMLTTPGYPLEVNQSDLALPKMVGFISFYLGIIALMTVVAISGWLQSKRLGIATTIIAVTGMIVILITTSS